MRRKSENNKETPPACSAEAAPQNRAEAGCKLSSLQPHIPDPLYASRAAADMHVVSAVFAHKKPRCKRAVSGHRFAAHGAAPPVRKRGVCAAAAEAVRAAENQAALPMRALRGGGAVYPGYQFFTPRERCAAERADGKLRTTAFGLRYALGLRHVFGLRYVFGLSAVLSAPLKREPDAECSNKEQRRRDEQRRRGSKTPQFLQRLHRVSAAPFG